MSLPLAIRPETVDIVSPLIRGRNLPPCLRVDIHSPLMQRRAVYRLAAFCQRELEFGSIQYGYDGREADPSHVAYLWVHPEAVFMPGVFRVPCVGATCFRLRDEGWAMQWVWLHPYYRRQGLLSHSWPEFVQEFGTFAVEGPHSVAMKGFLTKYSYILPKI